MFRSSAGKPRKLNVSRGLVLYGRVSKRLCYATCGHSPVCCSFHYSTHDIFPPSTPTLLLIESVILGINPYFDREAVLVLKVLRGCNSSVLRKVDRLIPEDEILRGMLVGRACYWDRYSGHRLWHRASIKIVVDRLRDIVNLAAALQICP